MAETAPIIRLRNLTKDYRGLRALDDVSLDIGGGLTGLLGPNGAGKSTLIKALLGLVRVAHGSGDVLGFDILRQARDVRAHVGFMPEDDTFIAALPGVETVQFAARLSGLPSTEALRRAHEILDFCGVGQERYRSVETYSTGMRQKLKFAQAIVHDPPLLILDEPTSGLDPEEREALLRRVASLSRQSGKSVLISTHILPDVQKICDSVVILAQGRVQLTERLDVLSRPSTPTYRVQLLGDPERFLARLRKAGADAVLDEDGDVVLRQADELLRGGLWRHAEEAEVVIRGLEPARNSLEAVFLEAVRGAPHADS